MLNDQVLSTGNATAVHPAGHEAAPAESRKLEDLYEVLQMYNDVTEKLQVSHERLQAEVTRLREQLEEKNRELELKKRLAALGEMAAGIAHEIRNPLGGIQLYASTLAGEVADRPLATELVRKISSGVKGLNTLVTDMLTFTRDLQLQKQEQSLSDLVTAAVELATPGLNEWGVSVHVDSRIAEMVVNVDGRLLQRVLLNLILNAAEAIGDHRSEHEDATPGRIDITAAQQNGHFEIAIADNGPGIPPAMLEKIFDPFFTTKHTGTGLGLAIVHRIIESHGGRITAENRISPEHGALFRLVM